MARTYTYKKNKGYYSYNPETGSTYVPFGRQRRGFDLEGSTGTARAKAIISEGVKAQMEEERRKGKRYKSKNARFIYGK